MSEDIERERLQCKADVEAPVAKKAQEAEIALATKELQAVFVFDSYIEYTARGRERGREGPGLANSAPHLCGHHSQPHLTWKETLALEAQAAAEEEERRKKEVPESPKPARPKSEA